MCHEYVGRAKCGDQRDLFGAVECCPADGSRELLMTRCAALINRNPTFLHSFCPLGAHFVLRSPEQNAGSVKRRRKTRPRATKRKREKTGSSAAEGAMCACRNRRLSLRPGMRGMLADRSHRRAQLRSFCRRLISFRMLVARQTLLCKTVDCLRVSSGRRSIATAARFASPAHENLLEPVDALKATQKT